MFEKPAAMGMMAARSTSAPTPSNTVPTLRCADPAEAVPAVDGVPAWETENSLTGRAPVTVLSRDASRVAEWAGDTALVSAGGRTPRCPAVRDGVL